MKHLTESQIAMSNFPYFRYTLDWTLDSLARLGAGPIELYLNDPHFHVEDSGTTQCRALKRKLAERGMRVINLCPEQVKYPINIASANPYAKRGILCEMPDLCKRAGIADGAVFRRLALHG